MTSGNITEEFMHEDLGYISLTKDAGQRNQVLRLDVRVCAPNPKFRINSNCEKCWFYLRIVKNLDIWLVSSHFKICSSNRIFHHTHISYFVNSICVFVPWTVKLFGKNPEQFYIHIAIVCIPYNFAIWTGQNLCDFTEKYGP